MKIFIIFPSLHVIWRRSLSKAKKRKDFKLSSVSTALGEHWQHRDPIIECIPVILEYRYYYAKHVRKNNDVGEDAEG